VLIGKKKIKNRDNTDKKKETISNEDHRQKEIKNYDITDKKRGTDQTKKILPNKCVVCKEEPACYGYRKKKVTHCNKCRTYAMVLDSLKDKTSSIKKCLLCGIRTTMLRNYCATCSSQMEEKNIRIIGSLYYRKM
jgi:hypothetical protein